METPTTNEKPRLVLKGNTVTTTSLVIAEHFGKQHKNVLRAIDQHIAEIAKVDPEFNRLNFEPVDFLDKKGELRRMFRVTRDGFSYVVMAFTGDKAILWRTRYINAFKAMEAEIAERRGAEKTMDVAMGSAETYIQETLALTREVVEEVAKENEAKALAQAAQLTASQIGHRLGIPRFGDPSLSGGRLSEGFMLIYFAVGRNDADAHLLWLLLEGYEAYRDTVKATAAELVEAMAGQYCKTTVFNSRNRLMASGLLLRLEPGLWRINSDVLRKKLSEAQLAAYVPGHPFLTQEWQGVNPKIQQWLASLEERKSLARVALPPLAGEQAARPVL